MLRYFILALARCFAYVVIGFHTDSLSSISRLGFIPLNFYLMTRESLYFKPKYYFVKRGNIFFTPIKLSTVKMYLNYPMTLYDTLKAWCEERRKKERKKSVFFGTHKHILNSRY